MLKYNTNKMEKFGRVLISSIYDRKTRVEVYDEEAYMKQFDIFNKNQGGLCEIVGLKEYQVKPYFDIDAKGEDFDYCTFDNICQDIKRIYNTEVFEAGREARIEEDGRGNKKLKHSKRFYLKARISYFNIPIVFKSIFDKYDCVDSSVYNINRILFAPLSNRKKDFDVPALKPINGSIFDCCATYILEDYEDLDLRVEPAPQVVEKPIIVQDVLNDDITTTYDGSLNFTEMMTKLSKERATEYQPWFYVGTALMNLYHRKIIRKGQLYELFDLFSSKADNYDADGVCKVLDTNISRFDGKGYGIKYLLECLKVDNEEYYRQITKKDNIIDGANDDIGASKIVVDYYQELLVICKGTLYVKYNDIWIYNQAQVNNLLIDMIGKLDIKFLGADGKRQYKYNTSIKHIKDCITCIKANQTIINDKFYDEMIKNNKFYLPFNDCIYSFVEKKTYSYKELSNIHFSYKINRNFPKFIKKDFDDLMNRVIIPIYPDEEERDYNAHIKARALAGCYHDKRWYGYGGSRNSGKGTETKLMRCAFEDFVLEFNAKCLIFNKYVNVEPAKALSWVVDKKDARIIISNEIDADKDTILNGAFIKSLASGGDGMEGRRLYENTQSFVPQFTMFLCYNKFYGIEPADAKENLEQFEYKSKFVSQEELLPNIPFLKLKDENIKDFIQEERIIDAYTLYILNAFTNPRMKTPECIKNSTELNNEEKQMTDEQFVMHKFITTNDDKDRLHTETIKEILNDNGFKISVVETGRLINRVGLGKYDNQLSVNKVRKGGFKFIKYVNAP